ncbi:L-cysteate sulfo-lyase [Paenibacillus sp. PastF-1]|nr:L-cysteate sulfo-lyase [Paenibacillus sp. PastF-2]MDF9847874.1 L-cysteate sulfo-lyase [Paenibacillus sp. PastM-2]MDF9854442.1 L-cysteate sulfo-lyase [Paenibacillus sp. PastF-1]MDH6479949.1 L-cysteate sulfo-lyase [Paenibacillus sp. PastH-2]MDH6507149.1 L-cysteate sulfo-lyase [Paenibacillus sp. PastM-3]
MNRINSLPRVMLGTWPTPLQPAEQLSRQLGCPLYIKREDMTGLGGGGNKARKLEFQLGKAVQDGATHVITTGAIQSNHAHLTAAAARRLGLQPHLVLSGTPSEKQHGNLYLDHLMHAGVTFAAPPADRPPLEVVNEIMSQVAGTIRAEGGIPCIIPEGGTDALGTVGYILAMEELIQQLEPLGLERKRLLLVVATGTCGTQAGLVAGASILSSSMDIMGVSVSGKTPIKLEKTARVATETLRLAGYDKGVSQADIWIEDRYIGEGYGAVTEECRQAIYTAATAEGLFLDPVYTGKAMAALLHLGRSGQLTSYDAVVFVHTGGLPLLFHYDSVITEFHTK